MMTERMCSLFLKRNFTIYFFIGLSILGVSACTSDTSPSVSDAKKILEAEIADKAKGIVKLVDFEKTNGIKQSIGGMELYILEYSATFEFPQETWGECGEIEECFRNYYFHKAKPYINPMEAHMHSIMHFGIGSKVKTSGKMAFQKTEKGWRPAK